MGTIDCSFPNDNNILKVRADIGAGWHPWKWGYGFFGREDLDYVGDLRLRVDVRLVARPSHLSHMAEEFPAELFAEDGSETLRYILEGSVLNIHVDLSKELTTLQNSRKPGVYWEPSLIQFEAPILYSLQLLLVFSPPPGRRPGDIREWGFPFPSAGLPGLGRRRR